MSNKKSQFKKQQSISLKSPSELRILAAHQHEHSHQHKLTISPFPSALEMEKIHALNPDVLSVMINMAQHQIETDTENSKAKIALEKDEQNIRRLEVLGEIEHKKRAQNYGLIAMIFLGSITLGLVALGAYKTAAAFATVTIIGGITAFTGISDKSKSKKN
ncbi:MAG: hypothetical protein COA39_012310 [Sulfurimonas sp.]|nr:hypothetical protein [Sulfurimonas sp.]